ncbi:flavin-containing amine oxidoreductase-domain containing protein [Coniella lustricola]|uniref:Flavin-containing amine oxidoreductase-domain containing protein n=1 Tax=Coniella lustricola TaxID=2025994 RepID=A0A2T3ADJ0_9PEZI|nr:flavin-containing amine oxidoreductase-domain containing protein [Coniella lustricola]
MKRRSQLPRSGQHSGTAQRTTSTRGRGPGSSSTFTTISSETLRSPASTTSTSSPQFAYRKQDSAPPCRRASYSSNSSNSLAQAEKRIINRISSSFPSLRPLSCPLWHQQEEQILAEIIVSTENLDPSDTMDTDQSDSLEASMVLAGTELGASEQSRKHSLFNGSFTKQPMPRSPSTDLSSVDEDLVNEHIFELDSGNDMRKTSRTLENVTRPDSTVHGVRAAKSSPNKMLPSMSDAIQSDSAGRFPVASSSGKATEVTKASIIEESTTSQEQSSEAGSALIDGIQLATTSDSRPKNQHDPISYQSTPPASETNISRVTPSGSCIVAMDSETEDYDMAENISLSHLRNMDDLETTTDMQFRIQQLQRTTCAIVDHSMKTHIKKIQLEQAEAMDLDAGPCSSNDTTKKSKPNNFNPAKLAQSVHNGLCGQSRSAKTGSLSQSPCSNEIIVSESVVYKTEPDNDDFPGDAAMTSISTIEPTNRPLNHQGLMTPSSNHVNTTQPSEGATQEASESELSDIGSPAPEAFESIHLEAVPVKSALSHLIGKSRQSFTSSASAFTDQSGMSSKPPSVSSKATTPLDAGDPGDGPLHYVPTTSFQTRTAPRRQYNIQPKVSIPTDLTPQEYAIECIEAAENSRLHPYALHQDEYAMLRNHISHAQVTTYLNIRNGILRLWVRNPQIAVTRGEAIGCARDTRWFDVANVCFDWLVRKGLVNYGCVEIRHPASIVSSEPRKRRTIAVIGAGFSGLSAARQLEGLILQYARRFRDMGEELPRVVVLEGRERVGGRVYSRAFKTLPDTAPGVMRGKRFTAEMGGMIITGFDRGNPLNILVRGQLGLPYHCLRSDMSLYDANGTAVDAARDQLVEHLFNACLDRVSEYKFKAPAAKFIEGNRDLMDDGRDSTAEGHKTIATAEETTAAQPHALPVAQQNVAPRVNLVPVSTDRMTGKVHVEPGTPGSTKAAFKAKSLGWTLKAGVNESRDIELDAAANNPKATLGSVVDEALMQHKDILDLNAQDFRLLNWHVANLEYSNATNLNRLSIKGWDIDAGNEWEGKHTMVVGGYQSVARGIAMLPSPLNIQHRAAVKRIKYEPEESTGPATITLEDGQSIQADHIVNTIPLGVLKHGNVEFDPPLPPWKTEAIQRLGFGVLNKVILVFKEAFWDRDRDIFGMLQTPINRLSLHQKDYAPRRGRFFQWFNITNTTGMPCLLALMAGDAGYDTEVTPNDELVMEAVEVLRMRYGARVTQPLEAIVTRWESDRFARGSYSNAGVSMKSQDYQLMARSIGNLHFAGEHTIVTHPATVHGAYLSGLRAASEVLESILGPIEVPTPLLLPRETSASLKRRAQGETRDPIAARLEAYEMEITEHIHTKLGHYPLKPAKVAGNPYLLFNKVHYEEGRRRCEEGRRAGKGKPSPNEVRTMTSKMWKEAEPEVRKPFEEQAEEQKRNFAEAFKNWTAVAARWEQEAAALREKYMKEHPSVPSPDEGIFAADGNDEGMGGARRAKQKRVETYREDESDFDMIG